MKRKIIQQGHNALTVTLPSKWAKRHNLTPRDFLNIEEKGNNLVFSTDKEFTDSRAIEYNITNLCARSIHRVIRALYKKGFDEVILKYENDETDNFSFNGKMPVIEVVQDQLNKLINFEIVDQGKGFCKIHDMSTSTGKEFYQLVRRCFLILKEMSEELRELTTNYQKETHKSIKLKHDIIAKLIVFTIRVLNRDGHSTTLENKFEYNPDNIIFYFYNNQAIHQIADLFNGLSQHIYHSKAKICADALKLYDEFVKNLELFYELFYKFDNEKLNQLSKRRFLIEKQFEELRQTKANKTDMLFIGRIVEMNHQIAFVIESEISIRCER